MMMMGMMMHQHRLQQQQRPNESVVDQVTLIQLARVNLGQARLLEQGNDNLVTIIRMRMIMMRIIMTTMIMLKIIVIMRIVVMKMPLMRNYLDDEKTVGICVPVLVV